MSSVALNPQTTMAMCMCTHMCARPRVYGATD